MLLYVLKTRHYDQLVQKVLLAVSSDHDVAFRITAMLDISIKTLPW